MIVEPHKSAQPRPKKFKMSKKISQIIFFSIIFFSSLFVIFLVLWYTETKPYYQNTNDVDTRWKPSYVNEKLPPINRRLNHIPEARQREVFGVICLLWAMLEETNEYKYADLGDKSFMEDAVIKIWAEEQYDISYMNAADIWSKGDFLEWDTGPLKNRY